jgi:hypothetical protein
LLDLGWVRLRPLLVFSAAVSFSASAQVRSHIDHAFDQAATEFGVPAPLLEAISFSQTRVQHLTWAEGDTVSCMGMPRPYGIMALWDNDLFGRSLRRAAELIGQDPEVLKRDPVQNIRGAAALLSHLRSTAGKTPEPLAPDLTLWADAIAAYTGIRQPDLALGHAYEVLTRLSRGITSEVISVPAQRVELGALRSRVRTLALAAAPSADPLKTAATPDYPDARWVPGKAGYYYTTGNGKQFVVVHDMEGYYASVLSYFQTLSDGRSVSIHYCVNGLQDSPSDYPPGDIAQMVEEQFYAWHAVCLNTWSIGIEHEGFASNPVWFTPEMYLASGRLIKYLCEKHGIPKDRNHIVGHGEWQNGAWVQWAVNNGYPSTFGTCNSHTDPGAFWDWDFLMQIVTDDQTPPKVTSTPPTALQFVDMRVSVTFDQRMEPAFSAAAFSLTPSVAGSITWTDNGRTMHFQPSSYLSFDTEYHVTIDPSARNYLDRTLDGNGDGTAGDRYGFSFRTVLRDTIVPSVVNTYPAEGATSISRTAEFVVTFTEQIDQSSLAEGFSLETEGGTPLPVTAVNYATGPGFSRVRFRTTQELAPASVYRLVVLPTLRDLSGNFLPQAATATFTTEPAAVLNGTVINTLDAVGSWWQPGTSGTTRNVLASFAIDNATKRAGTGSGRVTYEWTQASGGILREHNSSTPSIEGGSMLGAWVYGDRSGHELRFGCYYYTGTSTSNFVTVSAGPIDWTGWKLRTISTSSIPVGNGSPRKFTSFLIYQNAAGERSGTIWFDELTVGSSITDVEDALEIDVPSAWRLLPNYPNPFNPRTRIAYQAAARGHARLSVYNSLGQEVARLVDDVVDPGTYGAEFDASDLPSGMYVAVLRAGGTRSVSRMMLLR